MQNAPMRHWHKNLKQASSCSSVLYHAQAHNFAGYCLRHMQLSVQQLLPHAEPVLSTTPHITPPDREALRPCNS